MHEAAFMHFLLHIITDAVHKIIPVKNNCFQYRVFCRPFSNDNAESEGLRFWRNGQFGGVFLEKFFENRIISKILRALPVALMLAAVVFLFMSGGTFSAEEILSHSPTTPLMIVLFILVLYAIKSLSVFFPVIALQIAVGTLFKPFWAILLNIAGMAVAFALPYFISYYSGAAMVTKLLDKYPKAADIIEKQRGNDFFISFLLRIIGCLPLDLVSMYLGSVKTDFTKFMLGSLAGALPSIIAATIAGTSITDPTSPTFIISLSIAILLAAVSFAGNLIYQKRKKRDENEE